MELSFVLKARQNLCLFYLHCYQFVRIQVQQLQNGGRNLCGLHRCVNITLSQMGVSDEKGDVRIVITETAMLSNLLGRPCIDDTLLWQYDDIWCARVLRRIVVHEIKCVTG